MVDKVKNLGQIYTPAHIVKDMLDLISYSGEKILQKHIIDNSCGNGAFLQEIVERYIKAYKDKFNSLDGLKEELEIYIHGIEIDKKEYNECLSNLNKIIFWQGLSSVKWDVLNGDTLEQNQFNGKMDFVVANPPYVRVHNLQGHFEKIRRYEFAQNGMTDLFLVFYNIGFKQLNKDGKLCYITPNSFYSSVAGQDFRKFIIKQKHLYSLIDLGHYQPFKATTYTTICAFDIAEKFDGFDYSTYSKEGKVIFQERLIVKDAFNNGKMILAKKREQEILKDIQNYIAKDKNKVQVKNAFATLADSVFIQDEFDFTGKEIIPVLKASTGEWKKCIFPYKKSKCIDFDKFSKDIQDYLLEKKNQLTNRSLDKNSPWYAFGRSQAINDVQQNKIAINTTIKNVDSIKVNYIKGGQGVYSGLYILTQVPFSKIKKAIKDVKFIDYIKTIGKCKNGGYYTFSSNDLKQYLLYKLGA